MTTLENVSRNLMKMMEHHKCDLNKAVDMLVSNWYAIDPYFLAFVTHEHELGRIEMEIDRIRSIDENANSSSFNICHASSSNGPLNNGESKGD